MHLSNIHLPVNKFIDLGIHIRQSLVTKENLTEVSLIGLIYVDLDFQRSLLKQFLIIR